MLIRGRYNLSTSNIAIDFGSHLFEEPTSTIFHEQTHYYLSTHTNHGAVLNILSEVSTKDRSFKIEKKVIEKAKAALYDSSYYVQEGFAHLLQASRISDEKGKDGLKEFVDVLPNKPKIALSDLLFALKFDKELFNKFTEKIGTLAMSTSLHLEVAKDLLFIFNESNLNTYLADTDNNPNERLTRLRVVVEKDPSILNLDLPKICEAAGVAFVPHMSNAEKASLINAVTSVTDTPTSLTEDDITPLATPEQVFFPTFENMIFADTALQYKAITNLPHNLPVKFLYKLRTVFIYNNPESPQPKGNFGYYSFFAPKVIVNSSTSIIDSESVFRSRSVTKIIDSFSFDFEKTSIIPNRQFTRANIVWYKNFSDFKLLFEELQKNPKDWCHSTLGFTEESPVWFYVCVQKVNPNLLHVLASFPFVEARIREINLEETPFLKIIGDNTHHFNNFAHDLIGVPYQFDIFEMIADGEGFLTRTQSRINAGIGKNSDCICGSKKKWKHCHGFTTSS